MPAGPASRACSAFPMRRRNGATYLTAFLFQVSGEDVGPCDLRADAEGW